MSRIDFKKNLPAPKYERRPGFINFRVGMFRLPSAWRSRTRPKFDKIRSRCVCNMKNDPHRSNKKIVVGYPLQRCKLWHRLYFGANFNVYFQSTATPQNEMKVQIQANISMYHLEVKQIYPIDESCYRVSYQALVVTCGWQYLFNPTLIISCFIAAAIYMCNMCTQCLGISSLFGDTIY